MNRIILTTGNFNASMASGEAAYFVIQNNVEIDSVTHSVPAGSVLDFQGGKFLAKSGSATINLNGATIVAPACCIFAQQITVYGFSNSVIHSDWFKDANMAEHTAINKAIVAAKGIPVTLESRTYKLTGSIVIPNLGNSVIPQTLISPGILSVASDIVAITVSGHYVNLSINSIRGTEIGSSGKHVGTGIWTSTNCFQSEFNIVELANLKKGIEIKPKSFGVDNGEVNPYVNGGVQYCKITFQSIEADYGIYIDVFTESNPEAVESDEAGNRYQLTRNWFTEGLITGGRMSGGYGIYFVGAESVPEIREDEKPMNGLVFRNISFENLTELPMRIRNLQYSRFYDITFGKNLASEIYIDFSQVDGLDFTFNGIIDPTRFKSSATTWQVVLRGQLGNPQDGTTFNNLDTIVIQPLNGQSEQLATSSKYPFNMGQYYLCNNPVPDDGSMVVKSVTLEDLLPSPVLWQTSESAMQPGTVLPLTVTAVITEGNELVIDLTGLKAFAPCIFDIYAQIEDYLGALTFKTSDPDTALRSTLYGSQTSKRMSFNAPGLYHLSWDENYNILISVPMW